VDNFQFYGLCQTFIGRVYWFIVRQNLKMYVGGVALILWFSFKAKF
jgi:hypothetical protein